MHSIRLPLLLFLLCGYVLFSQQDSLTVSYDEEPITIITFDDEKIQSYRSDPDFNYEVVKAEKTWWDKFKSWLSSVLLRFFEWLFGGEKAVGYLGMFLKVLPYILFGVILFLLTKFFVSQNMHSLWRISKNKPTTHLSEEENIIKNEDIQVLIQKAINDNDYRLAIRYYYLFTLQLMSEKELIEWKLQKTNTDYLKELAPTQLQEPFKLITHLYDYIWYGNFDLGEVKYLKAEQAFVQLQKKLTNG